MAEHDRERWDGRWAGRAADGPVPPDVLVDADLTGTIPVAGRALDVACGLGAQSVWLALRGLTVLAVDVSDTAVGATDALADACGVGGAVTAVRFDADAGLPADAVDLDVIVCQRFRHPNLYPDFVARLRVGGVLVLTVLSEVGAESPGPFHAPPGELATSFERSDVAILHSVEADGQASIVARRLAP